jgi:cysteine desulfurase
VRPGTPFEPLMRGGAQERRRRGGTENVAAVVGLAEALERAAGSAEAEAQRLARLWDQLAERLRGAFGEGIRFNTPVGGAVAPHILNVSFPPDGGRPLDGEMLLLGLDLAGVMVSSGSACASGAVEPSHVLRALGLPADTARATVRFSLGRSTTVQDIDYAADRLVEVVARGRAA